MTWSALRLVSWVSLCLLMICVDLGYGRRIPRSTRDEAAKVTDDLLVLATVFAIATGPLAGALWPDVPVPLGRASVPVGLAVGAAGLLLRCWAMTTLGRQYTLTPHVGPEWTIVSGGPYRWLRHPGYLGLVLQLIGLEVLVGQPLALVGAAWLLLCAAIRIGVEERMLLNSMPEAYGRFRDVTRWRLVPWVF